MSKLTELFQNLKGSLHHGPSMEPLWDQVVKGIDALEQRVATLETQVQSTGQGLDPDLREALSKEWAQHKASLARRAEEDAARQALADQAAKNLPTPDGSPVHVSGATTLAGAGTDVDADATKLQNEGEGGATTAAEAPAPAAEAPALEAGAGGAAGEAEKLDGTDALNSSI